MMKSGPLLVTGDTVLDAGSVLERPIVILGSHITLDGNGAVLIGPGKAGDLGPFEGVGILAEGCSGVTLRNIHVRGFRAGLAVSDGSGWLIEGCNFSDNYSDPEAGWDVEERLGGIVLTRVRHSLIRRNMAQVVWNGLDMQDCHDNAIVGNILSNCSNVCLKLWTSCRNVVMDNDLSYGLRIKPGEVHARDSASVLMESGSDGNRFVRNDITHGGDGVFIRVLNCWVSTGNVFIENDCSYANNNGFEAWSPGNVYIRNRANHCSYGFWLGASDHTVLLGNEAAYNGSPDGFHNAPEKLFGHGGIVFVGGPSTHTIVKGNHCHHNHGGGIVLRGDVATQGRKWRASHWIIEDNRLEHNRWGIHAQYADLIHMAGNRHEGNENEDFIDGVTRLSRLPAEPRSVPSPTACLDGPWRAVVGEKVAFDASRSHDPAGLPLTFIWDIEGRRGDPCDRPGANTRFAPTSWQVEHTFDKPGFYHVALTVSNGQQFDMAWRDLYVIASPVGANLVFALAGANTRFAPTWTFRASNPDTRVTFRDSTEALVGATALEARVDPYGGGEVEFLFTPPNALDLSGGKAITFWLRRRNEGVRSFHGPNPILRLHSRDGCFTCRPAADANRIDHGDNPSESRWGWLLLTLPIGGDALWLWETAGPGPSAAEGNPSLASIERLGLAFTSSGPAPFTLWLDGLAWES